MDLIKKIGRHEFPILSVIAIVRQDDGNYEFHLPHGVKLILNEDEKREHENAIDFHNQVMQVYGMCVGAGLRT
jgi:hypothetical protein